MRTRRYFSAESAHGNESSNGFSNDTIVLVFDNKKSRDVYVENSKNISCKKIRADQATSEARNWSLTKNENIKPKPFSGEYWGIVNDYASIDIDKINGCIGELVVCGGFAQEGERLNK